MFSFSNYDRFYNNCNSSQKQSKVISSWLTSRNATIRGILKQGVYESALIMACTRAHLKKSKSLSKIIMCGTKDGDKSFHTNSTCVGLYLKICRI